MVNWFYDAGMSGDGPVSDSPGSTAILVRINSNGVRTAIVDSADRFARKMLTAELRILVLARSPGPEATHAWRSGAGPPGHLDLARRPHRPAEICRTVRAWPPEGEGQAVLGCSGQPLGRGGISHAAAPDGLTG